MAGYIAKYATKSTEDAGGVRLVGNESTNPRDVPRGRPSIRKAQATNLMSEQSSDVLETSTPAYEANPEAVDPAWRERVAALGKVADTLERRKYDLGIAALLEVGKSRLEAIGEAEEAIDLVRYYCAEIERNQGFERPMAQAQAAEATRSVLKPYGVFAVIAPFNFPVALSVGMTTGALLGGNAVVFKPAPETPLTGAMLAEVYAEAGLPEGVVNMLAGEPAGAMLVEHAGVDGVVFTGSHEVGMEILRKAASGAFPRPVIAEMGGKNPAFVSRSANLDMAAEGVMRSAFGLQGQKCSACSRLIGSALCSTVMTNTESTAAMLTATIIIAMISSIRVNPRLVDIAAFGLHRNGRAAA